MKSKALYLRVVVFGIIDALVSTVGLLVGLDVAGVPYATIVLTGAIYAFVEAFSMAIGNFLSEESSEEYIHKAKVEDYFPMFAGVLMFITSVLAAFVPIVPYLIFTDSAALIVSVAASLLVLFFVGMLSAYLSHLSLVSRGVRMVLLGGAAIGLGIVIGLFVPVP